MEMPDYDRTLSGVSAEAPDGFDDFRPSADIDAEIDPVMERAPVAGFFENASTLILGGFVVAVTLFCLMVAS